VKKKERKEKEAKSVWPGQCTHTQEKKIQEEENYLKLTIF
jgi:hypothetical protein